MPFRGILCLLLFVLVIVGIVVWSVRCSGLVESTAFGRSPGLDSIPSIQNAM